MITFERDHLIIENTGDVTLHVGKPNPCGTPPDRHGWYRITVDGISHDEEIMLLDWFSWQGSSFAYIYQGQIAFGTIVRQDIRDLGRFGNPLYKDVSLIGQGEPPATLLAEWQEQQARPVGRMNRNDR